MSDNNVRINELLDYVRQGRIMDAMNEFYADNVVMTEPAYGDTVGLAANLEREQAFSLGGAVRKRAVVIEAKVASIRKAATAKRAAADARQVATDKERALLEPELQAALEPAMGAEHAAAAAEVHRRRKTFP